MIFWLNANCRMLGFYLFFTCFLSYGQQEITNVVDHKNFNLNSYLNFIQYNINEKLGILPYILQNENGIYLEIGTGGDPIATLLSKIPAHKSPLIIASDIDQEVLDALPVRHPDLQQYLLACKQGPQLKLQQLDGTDMKSMPDNYLSGINASAVVHEIVSYADGINGLDKFFEEALRTLKPEGVLVYRDPEAVVDQHAMVKALFKSSSIRLFTHIFLPKFLDRVHGKLARLGQKYVAYNHDQVTFIFYKKNEIEQKESSYDEYFNIRSSEIDFDRPYAIVLPRGLCREIERHYLMYLLECNPLAFVKCLPNIDSNQYFVTYLAHSKTGMYENFFKNKVPEFLDNVIAVSSKKLIDYTVKCNTRAIEYGIYLRFVSVYKKKLLVNLLKLYGFDPNCYMTQINDTDYLLDYRILSLLYDDIVESIFDDMDGPINKDDLLHAQYLKREGEETYTYFSDDELIAHIAQLSLMHPINFTASDPYVLCPLSAEHTQFIPRLSYDEILNTSVEVNDLHGYPCEVKDGKRIIHFVKMPLSKALPIYKDIIAKDISRYTFLQKCMNTVLFKKIMIH